MESIRKFCWPEPSGSWGGYARFFRSCDRTSKDILDHLHQAVTMIDYTALWQAQRILESSDLDRDGIRLLKLCKIVQGPKATPVQEYLSL